MDGSIFENDPFYSTLFEGGKIMPLDQGRTWSRPEYADTITTLMEEGPEPFYTGRIAEAIVKVVQERGGQMTMEDLKSGSHPSSHSIDVECHKLTGLSLRCEMAGRARGRLQGGQAV